MTNYKEKVKRCSNKPDLDTCDPNQKSDRTSQIEQRDQFGIYLTDYALAPKKSFQPSEVANTESVQTPVHINFSNIFDAEISKDPNKLKTVKKQNTILESFYTEEMDFYDLEEEANRPIGGYEDEPRNGG